MAAQVDPQVAAFLKAYDQASPAEKAKIDAYAKSQSAPAKSKVAPNQQAPGTRYIPEDPLTPVVPGVLSPPSLGKPIVGTNPSGVQEVTPSAADKASQNAAAAASSSLILKQYGLDALVPIVRDWIIGGMSWEEAQLALYDRGTDAGKIFDARFPAIALRQQKGLPPISPGEYVAFEEQAGQLMRASGLPAGFYDSKDDYTNLIANDVSVPELQARIADGYVAASQAPDDVKKELADFYGVDAGHLAAHFLDPTVALPLIQKQVASAKLGAASSRVGLNFGVGEAEHLYGAGLTDTQATPLFAHVAGQMPTLGDLQKRFNDPNDPLTAEAYTNALVINDPQQLQHVATLLGQQQSLFSPQALFRADQQTGGLSGLVSH